MPVEARSDTGHAAPVLARKIVEAIEARVRSQDNDDDERTIAERAGMSKQQLSNLKAAVRANPDHVMKTDVAERLADAIDLEVTLAPKATPAAEG